MGVINQLIKIINGHHLSYKPVGSCKPMIYTQCMGVSKSGACAPRMAVKFFEQ
jgi:hypothetical protein